MITFFISIMISNANAFGDYDKYEGSHYDEPNNNQMVYPTQTNDMGNGYKVNYMNDGSIVQCHITTSNGTTTRQCY